jgi:hypothetical protein
VAAAADRWTTRLARQNRRLDVRLGEGEILHCAVDGAMAQCPLGLHQVAPEFLIHAVGESSSLSGRQPFIRRTLLVQTASEHCLRQCGVQPTHRSRVTPR